MLHLKDEIVRKYLLKGKFGLEKEGLRVTRDGNLAHTVHPFPGNERIVRDFCENQTEINTAVAESAEEAVRQLGMYTVEIQNALERSGELLWPFSNAPILRGEEDIPIAQFEGEQKGKTDYREYLAQRYGRYKMTFSGIHINYSFSRELLEREAELTGEETAAFIDRFYMELAEKASMYGWLLTVLTAASPIQDISYVIKGEEKKDIFSGMASVRCSELGYWNHFSPVLDYRSASAYADSIDRYVKRKLIIAPTELYYPIRLKPKGVNRLSTLRECGVDHIEMRMIDLNPLRFEGVDVRDVEFARLFLVFLASLPRRPLTERWQVQAVQNFKNAAHFDLSAVRISLPEGWIGTARDASRYMLRQIDAFYCDAPENVKKIIRFQMDKVEHPKKRYAAVIREQYSDTYIEKGLTLARERQNYCRLRTKNERDGEGCT